MPRRSAIALGAAVLLSVAVAPTAHAGPPWLSIELPANPLNSTTRGMYLLVRSYHHGDVVQYTLQGNATILVKGARRTIPLTFERTNIPGVMGLRQSWEKGTPMVLAITVGGGDGPTALVSVGADGDVHGIRVPTMQQDGRTWGRKVTQQDVDEALRRVAALDHNADRDLGAAGALLLLPMVAGLLIARRRG